MNRRDFLSTGIGAAGALALGGCCLCGHGKRKTRFRLAMAGYTLNSFKTLGALDFCAKHGFRYLCVKNFHLPFDASPSAMRDFKVMCSDHGVIPYGVGPIAMWTPDEAKRYFDYAAALGVSLVVGVPGEKDEKGNGVSSRRMCETVSALVAEYDIRFAIHNHGRNPKTGNPLLYPAVPETWVLIHDLDPRVGLCVDWAYTFADGLDCRDVALTYGERIFDGHVRCLSNLNNGSSGVNPARRVFDYDGIFDALREIDYSGCLGLELANAFPNNPQWIDESRDYFLDLM